MRSSPYILATMLAAVLLAGCTEETLILPDQSSYRQTTTTTSSTDQGIYSDPYQSPATSSTPASTSATPATGTGVQAQVTSQQTRGLFKKTLELTVQASNKDSVAHTGFLIATFQDTAGKSELQYFHLTLAPGANQTVTITSSKPAANGTVVFSERLL